MKKKKKLIILTGPTGIGKTELSFKLQKKLGCNIISADSRQVYQEMSIGTAKPSKSEIADYNIKTCDYVSVEDDYNVGIFVNDALQEIESDFITSNYSMVCGGTGMYIKSLVEGLNEFPDIPESVTQKWNDIYEEKGIEYLQEQLKSQDSEYYAKVDRNNPHRLMRAMRVIEFSGQTFSHFLKQEKESRNFEPIYIVLDMPRGLLYDRIERRVDKMISAGLVNEVKSLEQYRTLKALNTVAYTEMFDFLDGKISLDEAAKLIKTHSRQYAKRQLTWFRKQIDTVRFHPEEENEIFKFLDKALAL